MRYCQGFILMFERNTVWLSNMMFIIFISSTSWQAMCCQRFRFAELTSGTVKIIGIWCASKLENTFFFNHTGSAAFPSLGQTAVALLLWPWVACCQLSPTCRTLSYDSLSVSIAPMSRSDDEMDPQEEKEASVGPPAPPASNRKGSRTRKTRKTVKKGSLKKSAKATALKTRCYSSQIAT